MGSVFGQVPQVAKNQCISLNLETTCSNPLPWNGAPGPELLADGQDITQFSTERRLPGAAPVSFEIEILEQNIGKELIIHWRSSSWESRGHNNDTGLRRIKVFGTDGTSWEPMEFLVNGNPSSIFESRWQDDYVIVSTISNSNLSSLKKIKIEALGFDVVPLAGSKFIFNGTDEYSFEVVRRNGENYDIVNEAGEVIATYPVSAALSILIYTSPITGEAITVSGGQKTQRFNDYILPNGTIIDLVSGAITLSRLDVFTRPSCGLKDDIWLFLGNSETNSGMIAGDTHDDASDLFSDVVSSSTEYYPIVLNGGFGGETAYGVTDEIDAILSSHPEVAFVPFCYGLNDIMGQAPYQGGIDLLPYQATSSNPQYNINMDIFKNSLQTIIESINNHSMLPIPARMPWAFFPNGWFTGYADPTNDISMLQSTWGTNGTTPINKNVIDPIIQEFTPHAYDAINNKAIVDFDSWFHGHAYDLNNPNPNLPNLMVFKGDKLHHQKEGLDHFNSIWANAAKTIVYDQQNAPCDGCHDFTITNSESWSSAETTNIGTVTIPDGKTLTIESKLSFCSTGQIIIEDGGTLKIKTNADLTSDIGVDLWRGITVKGGGSLQGTGGRIQNAYRGIQGKSLNYSLPGEVSYVKGLSINCANIQFINNITAVNVISQPAYSKPVFGPNGLSALPAVYGRVILLNMNSCKIQLNKDIDFGTQVSISGGINNLKSCTFENTSPTPSLTTGIVIGGGASVSISSTSVNDKSKFMNFEKGITVAGVNKVIIADAIFDRCAVGIHQYGGSVTKILRNIFQMGDMPIGFITPNNGGVNEDQIGVALEGGLDGIDLEENTFNRSEDGNTANGHTYGVFTRNLGTHNNSIRNNTYTNIAYSNFAEGYSGDNYNAGLNFLCNTMTNPATKGWNIVAMDPTPNNQHAMRLTQTLVGDFGVFGPARNKFSHTMSQSDGSNGDMYRDFWANSAYKYYYRNPGVEKPEYHNVTLVEKNDGGACPRPFETFGEFEHIAPPTIVIADKYQEHKKGYDLVKFGGSNTGTKTLSPVQKKTMTYHRQKMDELAHSGYLAEIEKEKPQRDAIRLWMRRFDNKSGDYMLAMDFLRSNELEMSQRTLDRMLQKYEFTASEMDDYDNMLGIYKFLEKAQATVLPTTDVEYLEKFADSEKGQACYLARQVLTADYGHSYRPIISDIPELTKSFKSLDGEEGPKMLISPNPTDYYVHFDWSEFATAGRRVLIEVTDQSGSLIQRLRPAVDAKGMDWTIRGVRGNACYYRLLIDGKEAYGGQIVINN